MRLSCSWHEMVKRFWCSMNYDMKRMLEIKTRVSHTTLLKKVANLVSNFFYWPHKYHKCWIVWTNLNLKGTKQVVMNCIAGFSICSWQFITWTVNLLFFEVLSKASFLVIVWFRLASQDWVMHLNISHFKTLESCSMYLSILLFLCVNVIYTE